MQSDIMTPNHTQWQEFTAKLGEIAGRCDSKTLTLSAGILNDMGGFDVEASLEFFRSNGGYCDCEVLMNVSDVYARRDWRRQFAKMDAENYSNA